MRRIARIATVCAATLSALALAGPSASSATTSAAPRGGSGKTVVVGSIQGDQIASVNSQNRAGIAAAVKAINARGGVNGAKLVAKVCSDGSDPNVAAKCAKDFADDDSVVALVGTNTDFGDTVDPVLENAKLPAIGQSMFGLADFKSPMLFPADGGSISGIAVAGPVCINDLKGKTVSLAYIDVAAGAQVIAVFDQFVLKPFGKKLTTSVPIPVTAADLSSQAARLVDDNADCLVIATGQESATALTKALRQQGYKGRIFISGNVHTPASLKAQLGKDAEGVVLVASYDTKSALYKQFRKEMKAAGGGKYLKLISDQSIKAWLSTKILADEANTAKSNDRAAVLSTLEAETGYDTKGLLQGPLDYTARTPNPAVFGGLAPNVILPYAIGVQIKNGKPVPVGTWQDAFGGPS